MNPDYCVRLSIPRDPGDSEVCRQLREYGVATVAEAQGKRGLCAPELRPIQQGVRIAGTAVTVLCPAGDNLMIHAALEACRPGDVLAVATLAPSVHGAFGELLAEACRVRGVVGAILETGVRDTLEIRERGFPVWARSIYAGGTNKSAPGWVNVPMTLGGVGIAPGDFVVADDDGVVVVSRSRVRDVLDVASRRVAKESDTRAKIERGELSVDFYRLRPLLEQLGVRYFE
jgi:4-hydroxy-4-methyl-2-oxoglutarate aldolase